MHVLLDAMVGRLDGVSDEQNDADDPTVGQYRATTDVPMIATIAGSGFSARDDAMHRNNRARLKFRVH